MKKIKLLLIALMLMSAFLMPIKAKAMSAEAARPTINAVYPATMVVHDICKSTDEVILIDCNDNLWSFYGIDDWEINDCVSVLMCDNGTESIYDDSVMLVRYNSFTIEIERR